MKSVFGLTSKITDWIGKIVGWLVVVMMGVTVYEVTLRDIFGVAPIWAWDVNRQSLQLLIFLTGGYAMLHHQHVRVDIVWSRLTVRARTILDICTFIFPLLFCVTIIGYGSILALDSIKVLEKAPTVWAPPVFYLKALIPVGGFFLLLQVFAKLYDDIMILRKLR